MSALLYQSIYVDPKFQPTRGTYEGYEIRQRKFLLVFHIPSRSNKRKVYELTYDPRERVIYHRCQGHGKNECWHRRFVQQWLKRTYNKKKMASALEAIDILEKNGFFDEFEAAS